jgi:glutamyl-tRNA reductase
MAATISWLDDLRVCAWRTASLDAMAMAAVAGEVRQAHLADARVASCQRLEAFGLGPCGCDAPLRLTGKAALRRLADVAAGLDSVVLGEAQILGQVRAAFRDARGPLRAAADVALAAAREARRTFPRQSHAGHLLDRALALADRRPGGRLLVLGTGPVGRLVAGRGRELGFDVTMAGRSDPGLPCRFVPLTDLSAVDSVDVVVGCLGSGAGVISVRRLPHSGLAVDLGTPRNFAEPAGPAMITLADMLADENRRPHATALRGRLAEVVADSLDRRLARLSEDSQHPIGRFRLAAERARRTGLERAIRLHPGADAEALDRATRSAMNRLLHGLTEHLRTTGSDALALQLAEGLEASLSGDGAPGTGEAPGERLPVGAAGRSGTRW